MQSINVKKNQQKKPHKTKTKNKDGLTVSEQNIFLFGLLWFFYGISTLYGLFHAKILYEWFIHKFMFSSNYSY